MKVLLAGTEKDIKNFLRKERQYMKVNKISTVSDEPVKKSEKKKSIFAKR